MIQDDGFQAQSHKQGKAFEVQARVFLEACDFKLEGSQRFGDIGCEVDDLALSPLGNRVYFEYKGSYRGKIPGMRRTDTVKKGLLTGFLLKCKGDETPYVILTSHLPDGGAAKAMIDVALESGAVRAVLVINEPETRELLRAL